MAKSAGASRWSGSRIRWASAGSPRCQAIRARSRSPSFEPGSSFAASSTASFASGAGPGRAARRPAPVHPGALRLELAGVVEPLLRLLGVGLLGVQPSHRDGGGLEGRHVLDRLLEGGERVVRLVEPEERAAQPLPRRAVLRVDLEQGRQRSPRRLPVLARLGDRGQPGGDLAAEAAGLLVGPFPGGDERLGLVEVEPGVAEPAVGQSHGAEAEIDVGVIGELGRGLLEHPTARGGLLAGEEQAGQDHPRRRPLGVLAGLLADQAERLVEPPPRAPPRRWPRRSARRLGRRLGRLGAGLGASVTSPARPAPAPQAATIPQPIPIRAARIGPNSPRLM